MPVTLLDISNVYVYGEAGLEAVYPRPKMYMVPSMEEVLLRCILGILFNRLRTLRIDYWVCHQANTLPFSMVDFSSRSYQIHKTLKVPYKIVVAVPTNSRLAFSPPALLG